jgi:dihydroorotase
MKIIIKSAQIIDSHSPLNGKTQSFLIENGIITAIADEISETADLIFEYPNLKIAAGWLDMRVSAKDPGMEYQEDLISVKKAAAAGGFTEIAVLPNTHPVIQTKESISYQQHKGNNSPVKIHPVAAVTLDTQGIDLTEMIDLHHAGAVAFSDGEHSLQNADMVLKVLQYLQPLNALFINRPEDMLLSKFGAMNEGFNSTMLGMKGIPDIAEVMMLMRDLKILAYTGGKIHFSCISTAESVSLIREAKKQGLHVSCDIAAHQIAFDDGSLVDFDTNFKVNPPFRSQEDIIALWEGLADGTIDVIVSDHNPLDEESKKLEFDRAGFGIIGLETAFAVINTHNKILTLPQLMEKFTYNPRKILNLPPVIIETNQLANLTLFDAEAEFIFTEKHIFSKSKNTPFLGKTLKGKVLAVMNQGIFFG